MTSPTSAVAAVQALCDLAVTRCGDGPLAARASALQARLAGPLRVAIAGRVKAGKSTLLNALVGERLAATDAGECTKVVTTYVHGDTYSVTAHLVDGSTADLGFRREEGRLRIDLGHLGEDDVVELVVTWPSRALTEITLIDTPGLASLQEATSRRTQAFLDGDDHTASGADAVIYLMRHLHRVDAEFLGAFMDRRVMGASPVNAVAVLSRADEVGACRPDAMESAARIAGRYRDDPALRTLVSDVVPVAGLLAETGQTLREDEVAALRVLAALPDDDAARLLRSVDDVCEMSASALTVETRRDLLDRLGLYGLRFAVEALHAGRYATASELSRALVERSGLGGLRRVIAEQFLPRARVLQARSALTGLRALTRDLESIDAAAATDLRRALDEVEAAAGDFARLAAAHAVLSGAVALPERERGEAERLLLAGDPAVVAASGGQDYLLAGIERWRGRATDPGATSLAVSVCESMARVFEQAYVAAISDS